MKKRLSALLLALILTFSGCQKLEILIDGAIDPKTEEKILSFFMPIWEYETVSPLARVNYLDFETSSWDRIFKPEFVMVHFVSAIGVNKENPCDKASVRQLFEEDEDMGINYIIHRDGEIECYLPENRVAWHAGAGEYASNEKYTNKFNMYSIGIELVAIGSENDMSQYMSKSQYAKIDKENIGFTDEQYKSLKFLVYEICQRYSIPMDKFHIVGHEEYNKAKSDPGELFDWDRLLN